MQTSLFVRNVQEAYKRGLELVRRYGVLEETRNGPALVVPWPVMTTYQRPLERVLLDPTRDANPFFHLMESFWMLAGRDDVASLDPFLGSLKKYSDDGETYHGAYGHRWRESFSMDQLETCIELLRINPLDRRVVLAMWDPDVDLNRDGLDFPCNTHIYFRSREVLGLRYLDLTVCCRSNDAIWGAWGANAVHFSVLLEFVAAATGMQVGWLHQLSNNLHAYTDVLEKVGEPCWPVTWGSSGRLYRYARGTPLGEYITTEHDEYTAREVFPTRLFRTDATTNLDAVFSELDALWDDEMDQGSHPGGQLLDEETRVLLHDVRSAHRCWKRRDQAAALQHIHDMPERSDWRRACEEWLGRHQRSSL